MDKFIRKNVTFSREVPCDMELCVWLQQLPHGEFTERTKAYWKVQMVNERINQVMEDEHERS
jgi:hypothetical protein